MKKKTVDISEAVAWGKEPTWDRFFASDAEFETALGLAFNWYSAMASIDDQKQWALDYVKKEKPQLFDKVNHLRPSKFLVTGTMARIVTRCTLIPKQFKEKLDARIYELSNTEKLATETVLKQQLAKLDNRIITALSELNVLSLDAVLGKAEISLADWLIKNRIDPKRKQKIKQYFQKTADDLRLVLEGDEFAKESYSHLTKKQVKSLYGFLTDAPTIVIPRKAKTKRKKGKR